MHSRLFAASRRENSTEEAIEEEITQSVQMRLADLKADELVKILNEVLLAKNNAEETLGEALWRGPLLGFTLGGSFFYHGCKTVARDINIYFIKRRLKDSVNPISPREALIQVLDSMIGFENSKSYKYAVTQAVFGFDAYDDDHAKSIVHCTLRALKEPKDTLMETFKTY